MSSRHFHAADEVRRFRRAGAEAGALLGGLMLVPWLLVVLVTSGARPSTIAPLLSGMPVLVALAAGIGWVWGPRVRTPGRWRRRVLTVAVALSATVAGALAVCVSLWFDEVPWRRVLELDLLALQLHWLLAFWALGVVVAGIPSLLLTLPMAFAWRRETLERAHRRRQHHAT